jgi:hypothetical protein
MKTEPLLGFNVDRGEKLFVSEVWKPGSRIKARSVSSRVVMEIGTTGGVTGF